MINGVDILDPTRNFIDYEWTILGWNDVQVYVAQERERMNRIGHGGRGGGCDGGREYRCGGSPHNVNELDANKIGGNDEGHKGL